MTNHRTIRTAAVARVRADGVCAVAAEIGIAPRDLNGFLVGVIPAAETHSRLDAWFRREADIAADETIAGATTDAPPPRLSAPAPEPGITFSENEFRAILRSFRCGSGQEKAPADEPPEHCTRERATGPSTPDFSSPNQTPNKADPDQGWHREPEAQPCP